jgi:hypothetical protein
LNLLVRYLDYISSFPDAGLWHSCTNFLALARDGFGLSLDAWALGLCVAIEGTSGLIALRLPPELKSKNKDIRTTIQDFLAERDIDEAMRKRIQGLLGQLDNVRPRDRMESLVAGGHLLSEDILNWNKLRNNAVHTREVTAEDLGRERLQLHLDQVHSATRLLYTIIFHLIGYEGAYSNYVERNYPQQQYPFGKVSTVAREGV